MVKPDFKTAFFSGISGSAVRFFKQIVVDEVRWQLCAIYDPLTHDGELYFLTSLIGFLNKDAVGRASIFVVVALNLGDFMLASDFADTDEFTFSKRLLPTLCASWGGLLALGLKLLGRRNWFTFDFGEFVSVNSNAFGLLGEKFTDAFRSGETLSFLTMWYLPLTGGGEELLLRVCFVTLLK